MKQKHHTTDRQASLTPQKDVVLQHSLGEVGFPTRLHLQVEEVGLGVAEAEEAIGKTLDGGQGGVGVFGFDGRGEVEVGSEGGEPVLGTVFEEDAGHRVVLAGHRVSPGRWEGLGLAVCWCGAGWGSSAITAVRVLPEV